MLEASPPACVAPARAQVALDATGRKIWHQCPCSRHVVEPSSLCWNMSTGAPLEWVAQNCDSWRFMDDHHE